RMSGLDTTTHGSSPARAPRLAAAPYPRLVPGRTTSAPCRCATPSTTSVSVPLSTMTRTTSRPVAARSVLAKDSSSSPGLKATVTTRTAEVFIAPHNRRSGGWSRRGGRGRSAAQLDPVHGRGACPLHLGEARGDVDVAHPRRAVVELRPVLGGGRLLVEVRGADLAQGGAHGRVVVEVGKPRLEHTLRLGQPAGAELGEDDVDAGHGGQERRAVERVPDDDGVVREGLPEAAHHRQLLRGGHRPPGGLAGHVRAGDDALLKRESERHGAEDDDEHAGDGGPSRTRGRAAGPVDERGEGVPGEEHGGD